MAGPFSSSPAPLVDPDEAGRVWRAGRLAFFRARLAELGLSDGGEGAALLSAVERESTALDALSQEQAASSRPWWADGEYDAARADEANDVGVVKLQEAKQHAATSSASIALLREAAAAFTEAARLAPRRAVYHSNRAAAFLRLNQPAQALDAARDALAIDPSLAAARAREARALGALGRWGETARAWREVLAREPESAAARRGLANAEARAGAEEALGSRDAARWKAGQRPALAPVSAEAQAQRAERLLDAEQMWWSNPRHLGALAGYVEALLGCGRHAEAWERLAEAPPGWEREALRAEALWRGGEVVGALQLVREALQACDEGAEDDDGDAEDGWTDTSAAQLPFPPPSKIILLEEMLHALARQCMRVDALERALVDPEQDDGRASFSSSATELSQLCTALLDALDAVTAPGLAAALLCARATALGELEGAGADCPAALDDWGRGMDLCPGHVPSLRARARYFAQRQRHTDAFLDWRQLAAALPGDGSVEAELERAAKRAARSRPAASGTAGRARAWGPGEEALSALQVLGVGVEATAGQVRAAYLKLAGSWHPDKWATGTEEEQAEADRKFRQVQAAYEEIKGLE